MANEQKKALDPNGVLYLWGKVKTYVSEAIKGKVDSVAGKGLSTNDLTNTLKSNYDAAYTHSGSAHAPAGAQANIIEGIKVNGQTVNPDASKVVDIQIPDDTKKLDKTGDGSDVTVTFSAAAQREAPATGEKLSVLLGKLLKIFNDTKAVAFSGSYNDLSNKPTIPTVPVISTNIETDKASDAKTASPKAVASYVATHVAAAYKAGGSYAFEDLPAPSAATLGKVYNVTNDFVTDASFVELTGQHFPAGTDVAVVDVSGSYKYNVMSGFVDLSAYMQTTDLVAITNAELDGICV